MNPKKTRTHNNKLGKNQKSPKGFFPIDPVFKPYMGPPAPLNIPTPTPASDHPLGGHERTWGYVSRLWMTKDTSNEMCIQVMNPQIGKII